MKFILTILLFTFSLFANEFYYESDKKVEIKKQINIPTSINKDTIFEYETTDGKIIRFKNEIAVRCQAEAYCEDDFIDLSIDNYQNVFGSVYLIKIDDHNLYFDLLRKLHNKSDISSATPNYLTTMKIR